MTNVGSSGGPSGAAGAPAERRGAAPLQGLRIVELSSYVASPLAGLVLGQLGADVIRVEPLQGAPDRRRLPRSASGTSLYWSGLNKGKRSVAVDLGRAEGRQIVADLICGGGPRGGIVISNSDRWPELSFEGLQAVRPDVIHVLLTGTGDGRPAVDYTVQATTGFPWLTGPAGGNSPVNQVVPCWDIAAGLYLAAGVLAAELRRRDTGRGSRVRVALEDVALSVAGTLGYLTEAQLAGIDRGASGNDVFGTFGRDFVSGDGVRFMLVVLTESHWERLLAATGLATPMSAAEAAIGADFTDEAERYRHREVIGALLQAVFSTLSYAVLADLLESARVLISPYLRFSDLVASDAARLRANPLFAEVDQPGVGKHLAPGSPVAIDGYMARPATAPETGEHTDEVLLGAGFAAGLLAELRSRGVVPGE